jgi:hypothetical protein
MAAQKRLTSKTKLHVAKLVLLLPLVLYLIFLIPERRGYWDRVRGLDLAEEVAERFEKSVGPDDARPVRAGDAEFEPVLTLIRKYSATKLADDKTPQVIVRFQAKVYDAQRLDPSGALAQWTSPATPIAVMYFDWPNVKFPENLVPSDQDAVVGTLGNLHEWIARSREDFHFLVVDLLLVGIIPLMVGLYEYLVEVQYED